MQPPVVSPAKPTNGKWFAIIVVVGIDSGRAALFARLANEQPNFDGLSGGLPNDPASTLEVTSASKTETEPFTTACLKPLLAASAFLEFRLGVHRST